MLFGGCGAHFEMVLTLYPSREPSRSLGWAVRQLQSFVHQGGAAELLTKSSGKRGRTTRQVRRFESGKQMQSEAMSCQKRPRSGMSCCAKKKPEPAMLCQTRPRMNIMFISGTAKSSPRLVFGNGVFGSTVLSVRSKGRDAASPVVGAGRVASVFAS